MLSVGLFSCEKDEAFSTIEKKSGTSTPPVVTETTESTDGDPQPIILGELRENPYDVTVVTNAYNELYDPDITEVATTNLYVKFMPSSPEVVLSILETGEQLYEYDLRYKVEQMGDFNPNFDENNPVFYAVVPVDYDFPTNEYQIISNLHLNNQDSILYEKAFELTNNLPTDEDDDIPFTFPMDPSGSGGGTGSGSNNGPGGCYAPSNPDYLAGRIEVVDTELGIRGVKQVKVIARDDWFTELETYTNTNGCFNFSRKFKNKVWLWVRFESSTCKVRGTSHWIWSYLSPIQDYWGEFDEDNTAINRLVNRYNNGNDPASNARAYWAASTVNNALHQFHWYAQQDNINTPPLGLHIWLNRTTNGGAAPMAQHINSAQLTQTFLSTTPGLLWVGLGQSWSTAFYSVAVMPDMAVGIDYLNSDQQKRLAFHEMAHASHFAQVGSTYWRDVINAEVNAGGHGDENSTDAGRIAVVESWAEYIGMSYTHRAYGNNSSVDFGDLYWQLSIMRPIIIYLSVYITIW